jgi:hypothetical protein
MAKLSKLKKTTLTSSATRFAWAKADREKDGSYFRELKQQWTPLARRKEREMIEAALVAAAAAGAPEQAAAQTPRAAPKISMARKTVKPPKHLIYRTGIAQRKKP